MKTTHFQSLFATFVACKASINKVRDRFADVGKTIKLDVHSSKDHFPDVRKMVDLGSCIQTTKRPPCAVTEDSSGTAYGQYTKRTVRTERRCRVSTPESVIRTVRTELVEVQGIVRSNKACCDKPRGARILAASLDIVRLCPSTGSGRTVLVNVFGYDKNYGTLRRASNSFSDCAAIENTMHHTPKA